MKSRKVLSLVAIAALATTLFVGCGSKDEAKFKDGTYKAESAADERGYKGTLEIEVKDGKITAATYDEIGENGGKLADEAYNKMMKEKMGTNPSEAFPKLTASLVEKQDVEAVDTVTGATTSSNTFKAVAKDALSKAAK